MDLDRENQNQEESTEYIAKPTKLGKKGIQWAVEYDPNPTEKKSIEILVSEIVPRTQRTYISFVSQLLATDRSEGAEAVMGQIREFLDLIKNQDESIVFYEYPRQGKKEPTKYLIPYPTNGNMSYHKPSNNSDNKNGNGRFQGGRGRGTRGQGN